jgi:phospholipid/cholesterol/gamma-HCH transport system ATP-binding protein
MTTLIELTGIVNRFGHQIVHDDINLTLKEGEVLGLVGGSGSGKSVLLRTILGLKKPDEGQVCVLDQDVYDLEEEEKKELQRQWGVLFQDGALFSGFTVLDNVCLPLREYTDLPDDDIKNLAMSKIQMLGLEPEAALKFPAALSGGMVRRAALARALALDPRILFLDEPTGALDPVSASALDQLILSLRDILGLSIFIITHDLDTITKVCDRITMLVDKKAKTGTAEEMIKSKNPQIKEFFNGPRMHAIRGKKDE